MYKKLVSNIHAILYGMFEKLTKNQEMAHGSLGGVKGIRLSRVSKDVGSLCAAYLLS